MALLLDTHAFLWFVSGDKRLLKIVKEKILDIHSPCFLSVASLWEITIKQQIGKLLLNVSLQELFDYLDRNQIEIVQITFAHLLTLSRLPEHHKDPFDRLMISQAIAEDFILISKDMAFKKYEVERHWD